MGKEEKRGWEDQWSEVEQVVDKVVKIPEDWSGRKRVLLQ